MNNRISGRIDLSDYLAGTELARAVHCMPVPGKVCIVDSVPECNLCNSEGETTPGPFDFNAALHGRTGWMHGCESHYLLYRASEGLGVDKAQLWLDGYGTQ